MSPLQGDGGFFIQHHRIEHPQLRRGVFRPFQPGGGPRRVEGTDVAGNLVRGPGPVHPQLRLLDLGGVGDTFRGLRGEAERTCRQRIEGCHDGLGPHAGQPVVQGGGRVGGADGRATFQPHRAGIQPGFHLHDAHAGFGIARLDGPLDGGRSPPAWQQRGMDVQAAEPGQVQRGLRQQQAIGSHHHHVRVQGPQCGVGVERFLVAGLAQPALFVRLWGSMTLTGCGGPSSTGR